MRRALILLAMPLLMGAAPIPNFTLSIDPLTPPAYGAPIHFMYETDKHIHPQDELVLTLFCYQDLNGDGVITEYPNDGGELVYSIGDFGDFAFNLGSSEGVRWVTRNVWDGGPAECESYLWDVRYPPQATVGTWTEVAELEFDVDHL